MIRASFARSLLVPCCLALLHTSAAAQPSDPAIGHVLFADIHAQDQLAGVRDAMGRPVFVWRDRQASSAVFGQRVGANYDLLWGVSGAPVAAGLGAHDQPVLARAGDGVIVAWRRADADAGDIFAARLTAQGAEPWSTPWVALCTAAGEQHHPLVVADGAGGAIVAWTDLRSGVAEVYAQRVDADGAVQWASDGIALRSGGGGAWLSSLVSDDAGGAIAAWWDARGGWWAQRMSAAGATAWAANGMMVCQPGPQRGWTAIADGRQGLLASFEKTDGTGFYRDLYAQRLRPDGTRAWPDSGVVVCRARYFQRMPAMLADGAGGFIVTWEDSRTFHFAEVYAQRVDSTGAAVWTTDGVRLCGVSATPAFPAIASDGAGGAVVGWQDDRNGNVDLFAQRVDAAGHPLWTADGVAVSTAPDSQVAVVVLGDGAGGATFAWQDRRNGGLGPDLYMQNVRGDGSLDTTFVGSAPAPAGAELALAAPAPNPARRDVRVRWTLPREADAVVRVLDLQGREVRRLADGAFAAGLHTAAWDLRDARGERVRPGVWLLRVEWNGRAETRRVITIR